MDIRIEPAALKGSVAAPPSKSEAHRLLICAALADRPTDIMLNTVSNDIAATITCLESMEAKIARINDCVTVSPAAAGERAVLNCGESGSTLRFLLPVASALFESVDVTGSGRLPERPLNMLIEQMKRHGCTFSNDKLPFTVTGRLSGGDFELSGNVSSQFVSGLLLASPLFECDTRIRIIGALESSGYVDLTVRAMADFGVSAEKTATAFCVDGGARYRSAGAVRVGGDWSNAAFWLCAGALGMDVGVTGLDEESAQGDRQITKLLERFGALEKHTDDAVIITSGELCGQDIDVSQIPDLFPVLAAVGACARGKTRLYNAKRLRAKESDRIDSVASMLNALGIRSEQTEDSLTVFGGCVHGGTVDSRNDHRIAMAAAILSVRADSPVTITGAEAVNKSYPAFFSDFNKLGGCAYVISNR